jgi:NADH dehydrogenase
MLLVSGGTGLVGSAVVEELRRRGEQVAVLGRDANRIKERFGADVEARAGDVRDTASLSEAMRGIDIVVNAVQVPNSPIEDKRKGWTFEEIDLKGTQHQVDAAKQAGVKRFVFVSGAGAAPDADKHWFRFKWQAEQYLQKSGLEWVIVRLTWVYGPDDHSLNRIIGFGKFLPFIPTFGNGQQAMQPVFIDDVGRVLADAALRPEAANQLFELGGPETMTMDGVFKTALAVMGKKRPILHQPVALGKAIGTVASLLPSPPLSADAVDFITGPAVADTARLRLVLNPRLTPMREALSTYIGKR